MPRRGAQRGQATVELVALLPALLLVALVGWQLAVAAYSWTAAGGAARAGARAAEVGAPAREAALAALPGRLARGARVEEGRDGGVRVRVEVPRVVPLLPAPAGDRRRGRRGGGAVRRAHGQRGQAAVELLAAVPLMILAGLVAWQLVAVLAAGLRAEERVRAEGLRAAGPAGRLVPVAASARVPALLPGLGGLRVTARAAVRAP